MLAAAEAMEATTAAPVPQAAQATQAAEAAQATQAVEAPQAAQATRATQAVQATQATVQSYINEPVPTSISEPLSGAPLPLLLVEELLRAPAAFLARLRAAELMTLLRALLLLIAASAGVFGLVVGAYRGGRQLAYCGLKVPLVLLGTLVLCVPPFLAIARAARLRLPPREAVLLTLGACARFALVLGCLSPVLWLLQGWLPYHSVILCIVLCGAAAGLGAARLLARGLAGRGASPLSARLCGAAFVLIFALCGAQSSWLLRPFLVRPRTTEVPFLRSIEGDLLGSVRTSARSAAGRFDEAAP